MGWSEQTGVYGNFSGISYSKYGARGDIGLSFTNGLAISSSWEMDRLYGGGNDPEEMKATRVEGIGYVGPVAEVVATRNWFSALWYSNIARSIIEDKISFSIGGGIFAKRLGFSSEMTTITLLTRGKNPGLYMTPTVAAVGQVGGKGMALTGGGVSLSFGNYSGDAREITPEMLKGDTFGATKKVRGVDIGTSISPVDNGELFLNITVGAGTGNVYWQRTISVDRFR